MSKENVKKFYQAMATDEELRAKISGLYQQNQGTALLEKEVLSIASKMGLDFTLAELKDYAGEMRQANNMDRELDDAELLAVAGGLSHPCNCTQNGGGQAPRCL